MILRYSFPRGETNTLTRIVGIIKRLESSPDVKKRKLGKITVVYLDENNQSRTVTTQLDKNDYDKAIQAHEMGYHIELVEELSVSKRSSMICQSFGIID